MSSVYQSILESGVRPSVVWLSCNTAIISKVQQQIYNRGATEEQITSTLVIQHNIIQVNSWHSWVAQSRGNRPKGKHTGKIPHETITVSAKYSKQP